MQTRDGKPWDVALVRILIVEDSPVILESLVAALEEMAPVHVVGSAADEYAALRWLEHREGAVDLLIVDLFLERGSGLGVLRATAQSEHAAKRVVLTNYATPDVRTKCKALGADRVFDKSTELDSLISYCTSLAGQGGGMRPLSPV